MMIKLLISFLLFQLLLAQTFPKTPLQCKNPRSKICLLQDVKMAGFEVPTFPDLTEKHTLQIRSGNIPHFNENFTSQLGGVTKVTLGRLNIESLHIPSNWVSLNAESNLIRELTVESTGNNSSDEMQGDEAGDSNEDGEGESTTENLVDLTDDEKEKPITGNPEDPKGDDKENPTRVNPMDSNDEKPEPKTRNPGDSKEDLKETPSRGNPMDSNDEKPEPAPRNPTDLTEDTKEVNETLAGAITATTIADEAEQLPPVVNPTAAEPLVGYNLQSLNLANNKLQSIGELKCMVNLKELRLDGNELEFIEMETFARMTKLVKLSLARNKINHISSSQSLLELPSLEWFSLAFNRLETLQLHSWNMLQLVELDLSHNMLVKLDVDNFEQFVSLEKLALADNSWTCYWLNEALKEISKRDFITLVDRNDDPGSCPNGLPIEGICCSMTVHDEDESINGNLHERIQSFQEKQDRMGSELKGKISSFGLDWSNELETLKRNVTERRKQIEAREKELKDDNKVTEKDVRELNQLIGDCNRLLSEMESRRKGYSLITQSYTQSFYTAIALKNKLLAAMRNSTKLKDDLHQYEISFRADVN